jgi:type IV pilus assembly protein PilW
MNTQRTLRPVPSSARGFSLIELMIALVVGLLVVAAAGGIFISNKRTYAATETLGRLQENGRVAFELLARELREAGGTPCGKNIPVANTIVPATSATSFGDGLFGYHRGTAIAGLDGAGVGQRVLNTDAIEIKSGGSADVTVTKHNPSAATIHVNTTEHGFKPGDVLLICDYTQATIFLQTGPQNNVLHVNHNTGNNPGPQFNGLTNDCKSLSFPSCVGDKAKDGKQYNDNAVIAKFSSTLWYIGNNARGGRSLYRRALNQAPEEITEGINDMRLSYLLIGGSDYNPTIAANDWKEVSAVRIEMDIQAAAGALTGREIQGTDNAALNRPLAHTVTLRNRVP